MVLEEQLLQYGVLGLWTSFLIWQYLDLKKEYQKINDKLTSVIENNTIALTKFNTNLCKIIKKNKKC